MAFGVQTHGRRNTPFFVVCSTHRVTVLLSAVFLLLLLLCQLAHGLVLSRLPVCKEDVATGRTHCNDMFTGSFTLRNDESLSLAVELRRDDDDAPKHVTLTAEKSSVLFSYDMLYEMDVFSDFTEDAYEYSYKEVGKDPARFCYVDDLERCRTTGNGIPRSPSGVPLPWSSGKCCWCGDATFVSTRDEPGRRSALRCGSFDAFMGRSVWTIKTCPRVSGPWYSALSFGPWRWEYTIRVRLAWFGKKGCQRRWQCCVCRHADAKKGGVCVRSAPSERDDPHEDGLFTSEARAEEYECLRQSFLNETTLERHDRTAAAKPSPTSGDSPPLLLRHMFHACTERRTRRAGMQSAEYLLNMTTPGIYDDMFRAKLHITGSHPQTDAIPPPMNDKVLLVPTYPVEDPIVKASKLSNGCGIRTHHRSGTTEGKGALAGSRSLLSVNGVVNTTRKKKDEENPVCLSHALLVPKTMTDFSGIRCDAIGTSLRKWADLDGQFCTSRAGSCMGNQVGPLRREDEERVRQGLAPKYLPSTDLRTRKNAFHVAWHYEKEHVTSLEIQLNATNVAWLQANSDGRFEDIRTEANCTSLNGVGCLVEADCINHGRRKSRFVLSIPYCVDALTADVTSEIKPLGAVSIQVEPNSRATARLRMESRSDATGYFSCKMVLQDETYRRLDHALFNISFHAVDHQYQGLQAQAWAPNVNITFVDKQGRVLNFGQLIHGFSHPLKASALYTAQCNCGLFNIFCIFANFFGCLARARTMIVSSVGFVGLAATTYVCGPSATFCLKCCGKQLAAMRRRQKQFLTASESTKEDDVGEKRNNGRPSTSSALYVGTPTTAASTPVSDGLEEHERDS